MHQIHTTPGFIIDSKPYGEAGKVLSIFTKDHGLIVATAQGIRLEKSKLRYHAQDYSFGIFSLVQGREFWRLTSSRSDLGIIKIINTGNSQLPVRIALLLKRLLHGEEANPHVFSCVEFCLRFISNNTAMSKEQAETLESLTVSRILHGLGYVGESKELKDYFQSVDISTEILAEAKASRIMMNRHINKALKESHL